MKSRFSIWTICELYFFHPKNPEHTYQERISRIKNRGNECWAEEISWGNDGDSYSMSKLQGWIRKIKEFLWVDKGKPMLDFQWVFLPLNFYKHFWGFEKTTFYRNSRVVFRYFWNFWLKKESGKFCSRDY